MADNPLPQEDQQVTLISVREGDITVTSARALVVKPHMVALEIDTAVSKPPEWTGGQTVTMIYTSADRVMRLRGVLKDHVSNDRITVEPVGDVKEGDRRDYRRADVSAQIHATVIDAETPAAARTIQIETPFPEPPDRGGGGWEHQDINVSGSGLSFESDKPFAAGDLLDIRIRFERPTTSTVSMIGEVVRTIGDGPVKRIAVRFSELSENDQDIIVYSVFSSHFAAEGLIDPFDDE